MSLVASLFLATAAHAAGTALWLSGTPEPAAVPGAQILTPESAAPVLAWSDTDVRALARLGEELEAARGLLDVYDGEVQIMRRLDAATSDVRVLREEDRDLLYRALVFQGLAAFRYFPGTIGSDPAAANYRTLVDGKAEVRAWVDAIALDPDRVPTEAELPDADARFAFQEARAHQSLVAPAVVRATGLPAGGRLLVDGRAATTDEARVQPGLHRVAVEVDGAWRVAATRRLDAGQTWAVATPAGADELRGLGVELLAVPASVPLSPTVQASLLALEAPVQLVVTGRKGPERYEVRGDVAARARPAENAQAEGLALRGRVVAGGAWIYDGDFYLQHLGEGAPWVKDTVNAGAPALLAAVELGLGPLALSGGVDLTLPLGEWHDLPVGDGSTRLRAFPHLALGVPFAQIAVGAWLPWRIGVGPQIHVPLRGPLELSGAYVFGIGLDRTRDDGSVFSPSRAQYATLGVGARFGG